MRVKFTFIVPFCAHTLYSIKITIIKLEYILHCTFCLRMHVVLRYIHVLQENEVVRNQKMLCNGLSKMLYIFFITKLLCFRFSYKGIAISYYFAYIYIYADVLTIFLTYFFQDQLLMHCTIEIKYKSNASHITKHIKYFVLFCTEQTCSAIIIYWYIGLQQGDVCECVCKCLCANILSCVCNCNICK